MIEFIVVAAILVHGEVLLAQFPDEQTCRTALENVVQRQPISAFSWCVKLPLDRVPVQHVPPVMKE